MILWEAKRKLRTEKMTVEQEKLLKNEIKKMEEIADIGKSCTDDSHFIPMSELVKRQQRNPLALGNDAIAGTYDFQDGKDNGMKAPLSRSRPNIAELSKEVRDLKMDVKKETEKLNQKIKDAKEIIY